MWEPTRLNHGEGRCRRAVCLLTMSGGRPPAEFLDCAHGSLRRGRVESPPGFGWRRSGRRRTWRDRQHDTENRVREIHTNILKEASAATAESAAISNMTVEHHLMALTAKCAHAKDFVPKGLSIIARIIQCAVKGVSFPVGANPTRQLVAPAGSTWGGLRRERIERKHSRKRLLSGSQRACRPNVSER